jgi:hypothetical protein
MAVGHDIGDNALVELRIGDRQRERRRRKRGDIQLVFIACACIIGVVPWNRVVCST